MNHHVIAAAAMGLSVAANFPYLHRLRTGHARPHLFSWVIWSVLMTVAALAQLSDNGGTGTWVTFFNAAFCVTVAVAAFRQGDRNITRSDKIFFFGGIAALPLWWLTSDPLWAVALVTTIDVSAYWPTIRKCWSNPWGEVLMTYLLSGLSFGLSLAALDHLSLTTTLYPGVIAVMNVSFATVMFCRRRALAPGAGGR